MPPIPLAQELLALLQNVKNDDTNAISVLQYVLARLIGYVEQSELGAISQLTGDVEAGPGVGSQVATVVGLNGNPVSDEAPDLNDVLAWDGSEWVPSNSYASNSATRVIHSPGITPTNATFIPGQSPEPVVYGPVVGLHYKKDDDVVYGYSKIQTSYVSDASFHVHWTKNVDTNQNGRTVRWVLKYKVFNGASQDVTAVPEQTLVWDAVYADTGLTTRVVFRTPNAAASGFVAGYYVAYSLSFDPAHTTLTGRPVVISCDILSRNTINTGN